MISHDKQWIHKATVQRALTTKIITARGQVTVQSMRTRCVWRLSYIIYKNHVKLFCCTPLLAPRIGLYTASLVSLTYVLISWRASDCDATNRLLRIQINTGNIEPSPTKRASPTKMQGIPCLFQKPRTVLCSPAWGVKQSYVKQNRQKIMYFSSCLSSIHSYKKNTFQSPLTAWTKW